MKGDDFIPISWEIQIGDFLGRIHREYEDRFPSKNYKYRVEVMKDGKRIPLTGEKIEYPALNYAKIALCGIILNLE